MLNDVRGPKSDGRLSANATNVSGADLDEGDGLSDDFFMLPTNGSGEKLDHICSKLGLPARCSKSRIAQHS